MKAMIFAAGLGTRLKPFTDNNPKALAKINNMTLLQHSINYLQQYGINDVIVNVHHFADKIETLLQEQNGFGSNISISNERSEVLETGGGLKKAAHFFENEEAFVVLNVDVLTDLNLNKMIAAHRQRNVIGTLAVMDRVSSRKLLFDGEMYLAGWEHINTGERRIARETSCYYPYAFSGIQVLSPKVFEDMPFEGKFSLIDVYLRLAVKHKLWGYNHTGDVFIDVGKPESIAKAEILFGQGTSKKQV